MPRGIEGEKVKYSKVLKKGLYALYAASLLIGIISLIVTVRTLGDSLIAGLTILSLIAVVMNYVNKEALSGTYLNSYFRWQIRTFLFSLLWGVVGIFVIAFSFMFTPVLVIGFSIMYASLVWLIYRIVKGWLRLNENQPINNSFHTVSKKRFEEEKQRHFLLADYGKGCLHAFFTMN